MNYSFWLAQSGLKNRVIHRLLRQAGTAEKLYFLPESELFKLPYMEKETAERLTESKKDTDALKYKWDELARQEIAFVSIEQENYPKKLKNTPDAPYALYQKGASIPEDVPAIALVGARKCSEYGRAMARSIGRALSREGVSVVSGMARGIDSEGHRGALLAGGSTWAVLGSGADVVYPPENGGLYREILEKGGGIYTEQPPGAPPRGIHFPARNRIISGLCDVVVVVEAKVKSGSLITADFALEQGRDVYAVPGRTTDPLSAGANRLISQGAGIITDVEEWVRELDFCGETLPNLSAKPKISLEKEEALVYSCVDLRPKSIEELLQKTNLSVSRLPEILASLEQKGLIAESFKNCYIRRME